MGFLPKGVQGVDECDDGMLRELLAKRNIYSYVSVLGPPSPIRETHPSMTHRDTSSPPKEASQHAQ